MRKMYTCLKKVHYIKCKQGHKVDIIKKLNLHNNQPGMQQRSHIENLIRMFQLSKMYNLYQQVNKLGKIKSKLNKLKPILKRTFLKDIATHIVGLTANIKIQYCKISILRVLQSKSSKRNHIYCMFMQYYLRIFLQNKLNYKQMKYLIYPRNFLICIYNNQLNWHKQSMRLDKLRIYLYC